MDKVKGKQTGKEVPIGREEMENLYADTFKDMSEGSLVKGKVIRIDGDSVLIDIGFKSEGVVPLREFSDASALEEGSEVTVLLETMEDQDGMVTLSKEKADQLSRWDEIDSAYRKGEIVEGRVMRRVRGGFSVDMGVEVFLPASQVDVRPVSTNQFIGKKVELKVIKADRKRRNVVVSRRAVLEERRKVARQKIMSELEAGQRRQGIVRNITDFGAFVDLGGMDGLLHITDMTWGRISHPSEMLAVGDKVEVVVLNFDPEAERVSLGLKQKTPNPWMNVEEKYPVDSKQKGKVVNITDYGAFVQLEEGIEGLVHISEMSWTRRLTHPSEMLAIGDVVEAVVLNIDKENEKISLGLKQAEPNPWDAVKEKYPVGMRIKGRIRNLTDYGAFVELEPGIDGLVHISDMSRTGKVGHPSELVKKGDKVEAVILSVDPTNRRISLGIKQLTSDPWQNIGEKYKEGQQVKGKVVKIVPFGVFVELEEGVDGLVHVSELSKERVERPEDVTSIGEEVMAKITKVDLEARKIGLSMRAYLEETEKG